MLVPLLTTPRPGFFMDCEEIMKWGRPIEPTDVIICVSSSEDCQSYVSYVHAAVQRGSKYVLKRNLMGCHVFPKSEADRLVQTMWSIMSEELRASWKVQVVPVLDVLNEMNNSTALSS